MSLLVITFVTIFPVIIGGAVHSFIIKKNIFSFLKIPLDGGLIMGGQRVFGQNKTLRGLLVMVFSTMIGALITFIIIPKNLLYEVYFLTPPLASLTFGFMLGVLYILAELPNSFIKRRLGINPGRRPNKNKKIWYLIDQTDSVVGICMGVFIFYDFEIATVLSILITGILVHIVFDLGLYKFRVKESNQNYLLFF